MPRRSQCWRRIWMRLPTKHLVKLLTKRVTNTSILFLREVACLALPLVGYTWVLEQAGIRFRGIGGASAGAINAALLASLGKPHEKKSDQLLTIMNEKNFFDFVDGSRPMKRLIDYVFKRAQANLEIRLPLYSFNSVIGIDFTQRRY
jgi:hypothetical protein